MVLARCTDYGHRGMSFRGALFEENAHYRGCLTLKRSCYYVIIVSAIMPLESYSELRNILREREREV